MFLKFFTNFTLLIIIGCSGVPAILYKIDVQQGNVITREMVEKLSSGMSKSQVRFVLGTPLVIDTFRENRWDYVYVQLEKGDLIEQKRLTIFFENERLTHIEHAPFSSQNMDSADESVSNNLFTENNNYGEE